MIIVNCESEPVAKTVEFNTLLQNLAQIMANQGSGNYSEEAVLEIDGVKDALVEAIGLLRENIRIKKAQVVQGTMTVYFIIYNFQVRILACMSDPRTLISL